jgi:hypothetical protein
VNQGLTERGKEGKYDRAETEGQRQKGRNKKIKKWKQRQKRVTERNGSVTSHNNRRGDADSVLCGSAPRLYDSTI